jgi:WhiB family transcriptional regulator, redox-sensing transcriptional regulator
MAVAKPRHVQPLDRDDWAVRGLCKGKTSLFFAPHAERPQARARREAQARLLCRACPVEDQCRAHARLHHEYGFWGGESEEERHLARLTVVAPGVARTRTATVA